MRPIRPAGSCSASRATSFGHALTEIRLEPLSDEDSRALVANLLVIESLPDQVRDLILERAEGNPFFVEEVVRMLIERGHHRAPGGTLGGRRGHRRASRSPRRCTACSWRASTSCPSDARRSLRVAAVIGRQFPVRVLEQVLGATEA